MILFLGIYIVIFFFIIIIDCLKFIFGLNCENFCMCNKNISMVCDEDIGQCFCKVGFFGELCFCKNGVYICNEMILFCDMSYNGIVICLCKFGYLEFEYQKEGCLSKINVIIYNCIVLNFYICY